MKSTNNYLKKAIKDLNNFMAVNNDIPADLYDVFIMELRMSNLLLPAKIEGESITFPNLSLDDGRNILPLFTDEEELLKYSRELDPLPNDLAYYAGLVDEMGFDGVIINCEGDEIFVDDLILGLIPPIEASQYDINIAFDELKDTLDSLRNDELLTFIRNEDNFRNYDDLIEILKRSRLLNVVNVPESNDNIARSSETDGFILNFRHNNVVLFTDKESILRTMADKDSYMQLTGIYEMVKFCVTSDMDGIIINPGLEDYHIPRNILLRAFDEQFKNPYCPGSKEFAFRIL